MIVLPFLDLDLKIEHDCFYTKIYDRMNEFSFHIVNFPFLYRDVTLATSYGFYISQLVRFARVCTLLMIAINILLVNFCSIDKNITSFLRLLQNVITVTKI